LRKGLAVGAVSLLAVPIFSLAVSAGIGARANPLLWKAAILLLGATMGVPGVFAALAVALGRRRDLLARFLPWVVRPTMIGVAAILVLQGVLFVCTVLHLVIAPGYGGALVFWGAVAGFAFVGAAFVIARIVIGLDVAAFVTALPINLRGYGLLPGGETRYLPACAPDLGGSDIN
jgi:hypothetical protein